MMHFNCKLGFFIIYCTLFYYCAVQGDLEEECKPVTTGCKCSSTAVECSGTGITDFPKFVNDESITEFSCTKCAIIEISAVNYTNLVLLQLTNSGIKRIKNGAFKNLTQLSEIHINLNQLELTNQSFGELNSLKILDLNGNKMSGVPQGAFDGLKNLETLDLSVNPLTTLDGVFTQPLASVKNFSCEECGFTTVPADLFNKLPSLENLCLNHNKFVSIQNDTFKPLPNLKSLKLVSCEISDIASYAFNGLSSLQSLDLELNSITKFAENTFNSMFNTLKELDISKNKLQTLQENLAPWEKMTIIKLGDNQWICNCHITWLRPEKIKSVDQDNVKCASPANLKDEKIFEMEIVIIFEMETIKLCPHPASSGSTAIIIITVIVVIVCCIVIFYYLRKIIRNRRRREQAMQSFKYRSIYGETVETTTQALTY